MLKKVRFIVRDFFGFSRMEMHGFFILLILMIMMVMAPLIFDKLYQRPFKAPTKAGLARLDSMVAVLNSGVQEPDTGRNKRKGAPIKPQNFDPNQAGQQKLQQLGFKPWIAERIVNYREKVTDFQYKEDLLEVYDLSEATFKKLYAYIDLPQRPPETRKAPAFKNKKEKVTESALAFDLNEADTIQLKKIKGIGKVFANRIVKYRYLVGGFVQMQQLNEVYGLQPEVIARLSTTAYIENDFIPRQIALNRASEEDLAAHPYIDSKMASAIVDFRKNNGPVKDLNHIGDFAVIEKQSLEKIRPYLTL